MCCEYAARIVSVVLLVVIKINSSTLTQQQVRDDMWTYIPYFGCIELSKPAKKSSAPPNNLNCQLNNSLSLRLPRKNRLHWKYKLCTNATDDSSSSSSSSCRSDVTWSTTNSMTKKPNPFYFVSVQRTAPHWMFPCAAFHKSITWTVDTTHQK